MKKRLTEEKKLSVLSEYDKLIEEGHSKTKACKRLKVSPSTLYSWQKNLLSKPSQSEAKVIIERPHRENKSKKTRGAKTKGPSKAVVIVCDILDLPRVLGGL